MVVDRHDSNDARDWTLTVDGVAGVPWAIVEALGGPPLEPWRIWRFGHIEATGPVDYGPGYGTLITVLCEQGAFVYRPDETPEKQVQKVGWRQLPQVAKALGVA